MFTAFSCCYITVFFLKLLKGNKTSRCSSAHYMNLTLEGQGHTFPNDSKHWICHWFHQQPWFRYYSQQSINTDRSQLKVKVTIKGQGHVFLHDSKPWFSHWLQQLPCFRYHSQLHLRLSYLNVNILWHFTLQYTSKLS